MLCRYRRTIFSLLGVAVLACASTAAAQNEPPTVHWAFSSFLGTGWYQVDDSRTVFVFRISPRQTLTRSSLDVGQRKLGIEIHYPLTLGLHDLNLDNLPGNIELDNFAAASFTPGIELEIPVNERLAMRAFAKYGYGREFESDEHAWIWETGFKTRYMIPSERIDWAILGNIIWAGHEPSRSESDDILTLLVGSEARQPLQHTIVGHEIDLHWHATYSYLDHEARFSTASGSSTIIDQLFEIGMAFSFRDRPFNFWFWHPDRLGLGIKLSPDRDFVAITFTSRSWFTK